MKKFFSLLLCAVIAISCFSGCSRTNNEMTEENIAATIEEVSTALKDFDTKSLSKYVDSSTLSIIVDYAKGHQQFADLGKAIFENLTIEIDSINVEEKTVTIKVINKDLYFVANSFASELNSSYSTPQLLLKLADDDFLDMKLASLCQDIDEAEMQSSPSMINLYITQGKNNLIVKFDENAENAVSGGALNAIKSIYG